MSAYHRRLRSCFRGAASVAAVMSDFGAIGLYNAGGGDQLIALLDFNYSIYQGAGTPIQGGLLQGQVGPAIGTIVPMVPEEAAGPGQIQGQAVATLPTTFDFTPPTGTPASAWPHDYPFQILKPGWSYVLYAITADVAFAASFVWQVYTAEGLYELEFE